METAAQTALPKTKLSRQRATNRVSSSKVKASSKGLTEAKRKDYMRMKLAQKKGRQPLADISQGRDKSPTTSKHSKASCEAMAIWGPNKDSSRLNEKLRSLEVLVEAFKGKVEELEQQFNELRSDVEELDLNYSAVQQDYLTAVEAVKEEKETVAKFEGFLRNAELENDILRQNIPEEILRYELTIPQARPW